MLLMLSCRPVTAGSLVKPEGTTIESRFLLPEGYARIEANENSFAAYLRQLPLEADGARVHYYDGTIKPLDVHAAVIAIDTGKRNLQQCADAVMRLRGEHLFAQKKFSSIHFNFVSDGKPRYYKDHADATHSYKSFRKYMNYIFAFANTASLKAELKSVNFNEMQIGDVFIQSGNPYGHAVIVVDMARAPKTGAFIFLLAQSYMPAQKIHILKNPSNHRLSPWYPSTSTGPLQTPEWTFQKTDLRRFSKK
jgi:hypothetical protein